MNGAVWVMVVEDHDTLREATMRILSQHGYEVIGMPCAEDVDDTPLPRTPDLYVIDLNLPGEDGLSLARRVRDAQPLAGIVITTARTQLSDRVYGYEAGADIYLPKPVDPQELLVTLSMLSKRKLRGFNDVGLHLDERKLLLRGPGGEVKLADSEVRLLVALASAKNQSLERWQVATQLNPSNEEMKADNLQNRISQLRKKIQSCGVDGEVIKAIRGNGYRLCVTVIVL